MGLRQVEPAAPADPPAGGAAQVQPGELPVGLKVLWAGTTSTSWTPPSPAPLWSVAVTV